MITVYHLRRSRSDRILWLLEELGLDYAIETFEREPTQRAPAAMKKIHPLGKSPLIRDGDVVLPESGAIVDYIVTRHGGGRLAPRHGDPAWPRYVFWLHFVEGSFMSALVTNLLVNSGMVPGVEPGALGPMVKAEIARIVEWVDADMAKRAFAAGDAFTAADVMLTSALEAAKARGHLDGTANLVPYVERMTARPAYQRAQQKAAA
jgi:glutathione S-transferase